MKPEGKDPAEDLTEDPTEDHMEDRQDLAATDPEDPAGPSEDNEDEEVGFVDKGTEFLLGSVYEGLPGLPKRVGCCIFLVVVLTNIFFVTGLTVYNYVFCATIIGLQDTFWPVQEGGFDPYAEHYDPSGDAPIFICSTQAENTTSTVYNINCLLGNFTCEQYNDSRCPTEYLSDLGFDCTDEMPNCKELSATASVVSVECPSFNIAFGAAFGLLTYVQAVTLIICYGIYFFCCKRDGATEVTGELKDLVRASFRKE
jgi:hypothetical protein